MLLSKTEIVFYYQKISDILTMISCAKPLYGFLFFSLFCFFICIMVTRL